MTDTHQSTVMDLIGLEGQDGIQIPKDINSPEDFSAWLDRLDRLPYSKKSIEDNLNSISVDSDGRIDADLKTASRTFFKGHKHKSIVTWMNEVFDDKVF